MRRTSRTRYKSYRDTDTVLPYSTTAITTAITTTTTLHSIPMTDEQTSDFFLPAAVDETAAAAVPVEADEGFDYNYDYDAPAPAYDAPAYEYDAPAPAGYEPETEDLPPAPPTDAPIVLVPDDNNDAAVLVEEVQEEDVGVAGGNDALVESKSAMAKFNEEFQETLRVRKDEENSTKAEAIAVAEKDLADIAAQREAKREAKMSKNRSEEQSKLEAMEADLENDNSWQRVVKLVDLTQDSKQTAEDTKRMREVFIVLKNDVNKAGQLS